MPDSNLTRRYSSNNKHEPIWTSKQRPSRAQDIHAFNLNCTQGTAHCHAFLWQITPRSGSKGPGLRLLAAAPNSTLCYIYD